MKLQSKCAVSLSLLAAAVLATFLSNASAEDLAVGRFGVTNYGDWKSTGTAFNLGPVGMELFARLEIENVADAKVASSEVEGAGRRAR